MSNSKRELQTSTEKKDDDKTIQKFLEHVVKGEEKEIEEMLKADPSLAYKKGKVTDYSGRQFIGIGDDKEGISGFQYAIWARDTDMWLDLLPKIKDSKKVGIDSIDINAIPEIAKQQLKEVNEIGLTYIPPEPVSDEEKERINIEDEAEREKIKEMMATETKDHPFFDHHNLPNLALSYHSKAKLKTEKKYDFQITKALDSFVTYVKKTHEKNQKIWNKWTEEDWKKADVIWQHTVGGAQRLVPVHVANQYCRTDLRFKPPKFSTIDGKESLKGHRSVKFHSRRVGSHDVCAWFPLEEGQIVEGEKTAFHLGVNGGFASDWVWGDAGPYKRACGVLARPGRDLADITALCKARQQDFEALMERLLSPKKGLKA